MQSRIHTGQTLRQQTCSQVVHAQRQRHFAQGLLLRRGGLHLAQQAAHLLAFVRWQGRKLCFAFAPIHGLQIQPQRQTLFQFQRHTGFVVQGFIQSHDTEAAGVHALQGQALHLALVLRLQQHGQGGRAEFFGHRQQHQSAIGLRQQTALFHDTALRQGDGQIDAAQHAFMVDVVRHALQVDAQVLQLREPGLPHRPKTRLQPHAAQTHGIDLQTQERSLRLVPGVQHQASTSSKLRCTRSPEPVSSNGLRRKRWRNASGAMARKCAAVTFFAPCKAA